jgi:glutamine synthetase
MTRLYAQQSLRQNMARLQEFGLEARMGQELEYTLIPPLTEEETALMKHPDRENLPDEQYAILTRTMTAMPAPMQAELQEIFLRPLTERLSETFSAHGVEPAVAAEQAEAIITSYSERMTRFKDYVYQLSTTMRGEADPAYIDLTSFPEPVDARTYSTKPHLHFMDSWQIFVTALWQHRDNPQALWQGVERAFSHYTPEAKAIMLPMAQELAGIATALEQVPGLDEAGREAASYLLEQNRSVFAWQYQDRFFNELRGWAGKYGAEFYDNGIEFGRWAFELSLKDYPPLENAEYMESLKYEMRKIAEKYQFGLSFDALPAENFVPNGAHLHASLWQVNDQTRTCYLQGEFTDDLRMRYVLDGVSAVTHDAVLAYLPNENSHQRVAAPTYRRDSAAFPPRCIAYTTNHECRTKRYVARTIQDGEDSWHFELRLPGADSDTYVASAAMLGGMVHGLHSYIVDALLPVPLTQEMVQELPEHLNGQRWAESVAERASAVEAAIPSAPPANAAELLALASEQGLYLPREIVKAWFAGDETPNAEAVTAHLRSYVERAGETLQQLPAARGTQDVAATLNSLLVITDARDTGLHITPELLLLIKRGTVLPGKLPEEQEYPLPQTLAESQARMREGALNEPYLGANLTRSLHQEQAAGLHY